jgi:hypothetical protein
MIAKEARENGSPAGRGPDVAASDGVADPLRDAGGAVRDDADGDQVYRLQEPLSGDRSRPLAAAAVGKAASAPPPGCREGRYL